MAFLLAVDNYQKPHTRAEAKRTLGQQLIIPTRQSLVQTQKNAQHSFEPATLRK
jgi:hypothetical protein